MPAPQVPLERPPELIRLERLGNALGQLQREGAQWKAIEELLGECIKDARATAENPQTNEEKRAFWNGAGYALAEVWQELQDFQSGAWKQWKTVAQLRKAAGDEED